MDYSHKFEKRFFTVLREQTAEERAAMEASLEKGTNPEEFDTEVPEPEADSLVQQASQIRAQQAIEMKEQIDEWTKRCLEFKDFLNDTKAPSINYLLRHNGNKDILKKDIPNNSSCIPASYYKTPRDCQYIKIKSATSIRRLTPRECFRLMDFPDTFTWPVSDSQAYKQAGNSIVVRVLEKIIKNLPL